MAAGSILIVDDIATNRVVMKVKLDAAFHRTLLAADGAGCLRLARVERPDLILLDHDLPDMNGLAVLRKLRADPLTCRIPVLMVSAATDAEARQAALAAGAEEFLSKSVEDQLLMARIRNILRLREEWDAFNLPLFQLDDPAEGFVAPGRIGLVFSRTEQALRLRRNLATISADLFTPLRREDALASPSTEVFVIDADLARGGGLRLLSELRSRGETRQAGICLWQSGGTDAALAAQAFDLGADDVLSDAMPPREIALRLAGVLARRREAQRRRALLHDTARLAAIDPLTGLWNRRYALPRLSGMARDAALSGRSLAVLVLDIDHFKSVNDRHGHSAGDSVLVEVARRLRGPAGTTGDSETLVARIGGEEFLVAFPCISLQDASRRAEVLRETIRRPPLGLSGLPPVAVTISVGVALVSQCETVSAALERADHALLAAKTQGRDRVTLARHVA